MPGKTSKKSETKLDEAQVADWLGSQPEFFIRHPALLSGMELPVDSGPAISLQQYQVRILREEKTQLTQKLSVLVKNVKTNHKIHSDLLELASRMIALARADEPLEKHLELIRQHFALSAVEVIQKSAKSESFNKLKKLLSRHASLCVDNPEAQITTEIFADRADKVQSYALVPIKQGKTCLAYLMLGADDKERFRPGMGGEFLKQLAQLLSSLIDNVEP